MYSIDLNSDIGESFGAYKLGDDEAILQQITAANVACGWHAGDPMVMDKVVRMASERGVVVGAHPGYPDLMGFGRRTIIETTLVSHELCKISDRSVVCIYTKLWNEAASCSASWSHGKSVPVR